MDITTESRVGEIAAAHPLATRVFARHGIDFCCGGGVPLSQACAKRELDAGAVVAEIEATLADGDDAGEHWSEAPLDALVRHILADYHEPLREELPRLETMARKVNRVHGEREPVRLPALLETYLALEAEISRHLADEETGLFPAILERGASVTGAAALLDDHREVGRRLAEIRELTDDFVPPEGACNTWRALWAGLEALESSLHEHIHLENNVLFPRLAAA